MRKHKISVVDTPIISCATAFSLSLFAAAHLRSAPRAHPMLTCKRCHGCLAALLRFKKILFKVMFLWGNLRYHPPSPLFTLSPGCSLFVWCLVVNPPTEPLFHRATLSCELAGSSAASLCSSHPLHGAVELETTRNFCDQGTPAPSKSVRKHKISAVEAHIIPRAAVFLLFLAAA